MELATKYALIPEEDLTRHVPTKKQMTELDVAMSKILNSSLLDHEKVQRYYELLKRKLNLQEFNVPWTSKPFDDDEEKRKSEPVHKEPTKTDPIQSERKSEPINKESTKTESIQSEVKLEPSQSHQEDDYDEFVISSVPKNMKRQAESLLKLLKSRSSKMEWDRTGKVSYNGSTLQDANLAELFHLIFHVNKKPVKSPNEFLHALREVGVPPSLIKNKYLSLETKTKTISPRRNLVKPKHRPTGHVSKPNVLLNPTWSNLY